MVGNKINMFLIVCSVMLIISIFPYNELKYGRDFELFYNESTPSMVPDFPMFPFSNTKMQVKHHSIINTDHDKKIFSYVICKPIELLLNDSRNPSTNLCILLNKYFKVDYTLCSEEFDNEAQLVTPIVFVCMDNGVMIARFTVGINFYAGVNKEKILV